MRFINSKFHAVIDYSSGILMLCLPSFIVTTHQPVTTWLPLVAGVIILLQAIITCYEGGIIGIVPLYVHLIVDIVLGLGLLMVPWIFEINGTIKVIFLIMGVLAIVFGLFTQLHPSGRRRIYNHFK